MNIILRRGTAADAKQCGRICYDAFCTINREHNFPPEFPSQQAAMEFVAFMLSTDDVYGVVAEADGKIAGSCFLWEDGLIGGIGPITVDPQVQNATLGKRMMQDVMARAAEHKLVSVRLVQAAFHSRSMCLYTKLGFDIREPLVCMKGPPLGKMLPGRTVRAVMDNDVDACNALCQAIHGHARAFDLRGAIAQGTARLVESGGEITGYTTGVGFVGHTLGRCNDDVKALIADAKDFAMAGFLLPSRNGELFRWCLANGLRVIQPMTLMSTGLYNEPAGAFMPSILY